jgi:hypothetical protein
MTWRNRLFKNATNLEGMKEGPKSILKMCAAMTEKKAARCISILVTATAKCMAERSLSALYRIKTYLRSQMLED